MFKNKKENIWNILLFFTLFTVVTSQVCIKFSSFNDNRHAVATSADGIIYDMSASLKVTLEYKGKIPQDLPEILVNGERVAYFESEKKTITLETDSVIEVYTHTLSADSYVTISSYDKNLTLVTHKTEIPLNKGFNIIGRFLLQ